MKVQVAAVAVTPVAPVRRLRDGLKMSISWRRASDYGLMDTCLEHDRLISGFSESFLSLSAQVSPPAGQRKDHDRRRSSAN